MGHEVTVATTDAYDFELFWDPTRRRVKEDRGNHQGVNIRRFPVRHLPASRIAFPGIRRLLSLISKIDPLPTALMMRLARLTPWVPELWKWTANEDRRFDLIAGMTIGFESLMAAGQAYARRLGVPFVSYPLTHLGAGPEPGTDPVSRFYTMRHQLDLVTTSDMVIAQTETEKQFYQRQGQSGERIEVVGPGVDTQGVLGGNGERFRKKHDVKNPLILFIGYLSRDKGAFHTMDAVRRLWQRNRAAELALIGTISSSFQSYFNNLPDQDRKRMHLLGPVDDDEKRDALAASAIVSMPSRTDSFGITYLEAWLYGIPVIAARTWGVMDVVTNGEDGFVVPFGDDAELARAMMQLIDHPAQAKEMGIRGRDKVYRNHTWDQKNRKVSDIYRKLAREGGSR